MVAKPKMVPSAPIKVAALSRPSTEPRSGGAPARQTTAWSTPEGSAESPTTVPVPTTIAPLALNAFGVKSC